MFRKIIAHPKECIKTINKFNTSLSDEDGALLFPSSANFSRSFQKLKLIDYKV